MLAMAVDDVVKNKYLIISIGTDTLIINDIKNYNKALYWCLDIVKHDAIC